MKLLHVDASISDHQSVSRRLSAAVVERLVEDAPDAEILRWDLNAEPIGHLTGSHLAAAQDDEPVAAALKEDIDRGNRALHDFLEADMVVIGAPMYNFSVASQLKAWIDRLLVAGRTFRHTDKGPVGLSGGKRVIVASSRGGFYGPDTAMASFDHQERYLRNVFQFIGITDVTFVRAEGLNVGEDQRRSAIEAAFAQAQELAA